jgi:hypothetical protein
MATAARPHRSDAAKLSIDRPPDRGRRTRPFLVSSLAAAGQGADKSGLAFEDYAAACNPRGAADDIPSVT